MLGVRGGAWDSVLVAMAAVAASAAALWFFFERGDILYYGDAQAHLNIARRIIDSRTPGIDQIGTVWLPLPHLLMLPLVRNDELWRTGLAGAIPAAACFVMAVTFLYAAAKHAFESRAAGAVAAALFALNPNVLYVQSTPMSEPVFFAALAVLVYSTVRFTRSPSLWWAAAAGVAALAGSLARYEGWFVLPFTAAWFLVRRRWLAACLFSGIALLGPLAWLAHNWWWYGSFFEFYSGPYSAKAIQGVARYPGDGNWRDAFTQLHAAMWLCAGSALLWLGGLGALGAFARRVFWPILLLALVPAFYVWSAHSGGTPIFVPHLWPHSYYNTRYGLAVMPLASFAAASLAAWTPRRWRELAALIVIFTGVSVWLFNPGEGNWITWKESEVNSHARRAWTQIAATYLNQEYRRGSGIFTTFGDVTGIFAAAGIPLRETLTWDNSPVWLAAVARPDLFLREEWAVAVAGDKVQSTVLRASRPGAGGPRYTLQKTIIVKDAPVIEIYRRSSVQLGPK